GDSASAAAMQGTSARGIRPIRDRLIARGIAGKARAAQKPSVGGIAKTTATRHFPGDCRHCLDQPKIMPKPVPADGLIGAQRHLAIVVVSLGTILTAIDGNIVNIALPTIMREFDVTAAASVLIVNAYQIGMLVCLLPLSALGAVIGYRQVFLSGMMV